MTYFIGILFIWCCSALFWFNDLIYSPYVTAIVTGVLLGSGSTIILVTSLSLTTNLIGTNTGSGKIYFYSFIYRKARKHSPGRSKSKASAYWTSCKSIVKKSPLKDRFIAQRSSFFVNFFPMHLRLVPGTEYAEIRWPRGMFVGSPGINMY